MRETLLGFVVGGGLGFILGYIVALIRATRKDVSEVLAIERKHDERGLLEHRVAFNITFSLMMIFVLYAAYSSFQNGRDIKENVEQNYINTCRSGQESRGVTRDIVDAVYDLATSIINRNKSDPPRTPEEIARVNLFIDQANAFRENAYNQIGPSDGCKQYVTDDDVEPSTPPVQHLG